MHKVETCLAAVEKKIQMTVADNDKSERNKLSLYQEYDCCLALQFTSAYELTM